MDVIYPISEDTSSDQRSCCFLSHDAVDCQIENLLERSYGCLSLWPEYSIYF